MPTHDRVRNHTDDDVQAQIDAEAQEQIEALRGAPPEELRRRLKELRQEWDVERALQVNASSLILVSSVVGGLRTRSPWFVAPAVVAGFLLQHGLQGWCPPLPVLRRLGFRTQREIDAERTAVRLLRGDLKAPTDVPPA